ncbi:hypothetical protein [Paracoccus spongiarum]|uniref:SHOCT domain-containing protein n=1 Tax=Paracoccus spongiarum TaxID=3064387 RepID=A0ABT9J813_9RHOB|nr:hypothetical protein [Paracoccus sp. 2205BS29-5]MDP5305953.1 hypothetical protein [Paracoccus sp. 2205BS29-5]
MTNSDEPTTLPDKIRQQLLDFRQAGLIDADEMDQAAVAVLQRLACPAIRHNPWTGNRNAPPLAQRGL